MAMKKPRSSRQSHTETMPLGLGVTAAAEGLGVSRKVLSELINGYSGISPDMAVRL